MTRPQVVLGARPVGPWSRRAAAAVCVAGAFVILLPFFWMVSTSLKSLGEVFLIPVRWVPSEPQWNSYRQATTLIPFWRYFWNSLVIGRRADRAATSLARDGSRARAGFLRRPRSMRGPIPRRRWILAVTAPCRWRGRTPAPARRPAPG